MATHYNLSATVRRVLHRFIAYADGSFLFLLLLPVFFTLHGWNTHFNYLYLSNVFVAFLIASGIVFFLFFIGWLFSKQIQPAVYFAFFSAALFFFYPVSDNDLDAATVITQPLFAAVILLVCTTLLLFLMRIGWLTAVSLNRYFNLLFVVLVAVELVQVGVGYLRKPTVLAPVFFKADQQQQKMKAPPVYILLLDEYSGAHALQRTTGYNNSAMIDSLQQLGFYVAGASKSNYDYTILSLASMFNGHYNPKPAVVGSYDNANYKPALLAIRNNRFFNTLSQMGYSTVNLSPLDLPQQRRFYHHISLPGSEELIFQSTILWQGLDLLPMFVARRLPGDALLQRLVEHRTKYNTLVLDSVLRLAQERRQVLCYTHLMMPHAIYARDSSGQIATGFLRKKQLTPKDLQDAYLQYFTYANKVMLPFTRQLINETSGEAIILLLSDHGSRHLFTNSDAQVRFENLVAVYYPNRNYASWYSEVSNVNVMRILLSDLTGKQLPLLKDSLVLE